MGDRIVHSINGTLKTVLSWSAKVGWLYGKHLPVFKDYSVHITLIKIGCSAYTVSDTFPAIKWIKSIVGIYYPDV